MRAVFLLMLWVCLSPVGAQGRLRVPLKEGWQFARWGVADLRGNDLPNWKEVVLPHTWNATDAQSGDGMYAGIGWYRRSVVVPQAWVGRRVFVRFEGVGSVADVFVNGKHVGQHKGAYGAFCLDITDAVKPGENELRVRADNTARPDVLPVNHFLFAIFGGIYRPAELLVLDPVHITPTDHGGPGVVLRTQKLDASEARVEVRVKLANLGRVPRNLTLHTDLRDQAGQLVSKVETPVTVRPSGVQNCSQDLRLDHPRRWHGRRDPYLYRATVSLREGATVVDEVEQPLGLRTFRIDPEKGFILNDEPYPLRGVCRHQEMENKGSALTDADHQRDLDLMAEIGASSLRLAHYQQAEYVYAVADRMGFLVWAEIPFVNTWTGQEGENARQQLQELIRQNINHPSIFTWGLHNEVYAKDTTEFPVRLTQELHDLAKLEDPDRPTVAVTGYGDLEKPMNHHADLQGHNRYFGWYEGKMGDIVGWLEKAKTRPGTLISLSEYGAEGNWKQQSEEDQKPGHPTSGQFHPEGYQSRFHEVHLAAIEQAPHIWGTYVWNMFDFTCPWWNRGGVPGRNQKGLVSYDRSVKKDAFFLYKAAWNPAPMVHLADKRLVKRTQADQTLHAYANVGDLQLTLNGVPQGPGLLAGPRVHRTWRVTLKPGKNLVQLTGRQDGRVFTDRAELELVVR